MTLNNSGSALINLGRLDDARASLQQALTIDPEYAVPHFNLAVVAAAEDNRDKAVDELKTAESLGFRRTQIDHVIQLAQQALASIEGRGGG